MRWAARTNRLFHVPSELIDLRLGCTAGRGDLTAACLAMPERPSRRRAMTSYTGTYQPYLYVPAGLAIRAADTPDAAIRLGRAATLGIALALLVAAV
jgi:hypothetical protein